jgi:transcriptional regulator with XRE-family HTH domain
MAKRKQQKIAHAESVRMFAARLREVRYSRGMTQADLAHQARVSEAYIGRLERAEGAPGIDLVDRLARALGTTSADLLPTTAPPDTLAVLRDQARGLFETLLETADRETLLTLCPLLRRFIEKTK